VGVLKLSQRRFQYLGGETDSGQRWRIPVVLRAAVKRGYVERRLLLDAEAASVELPAKADWIVVNSGGHGFYRVRYGPALLKKLAHAAMKIAPIERFNLLSDSFALAQAGLMPAVDYLDLTARFSPPSPTATCGRPSIPRSPMSIE
jgi:puromycin-sensitive aminopeptidase